MIPPEILSRKGARKPADVPEAVLHYLHLGQIETANLSEWLAVDQRMLFAHIAAQLAFPPGLTAAVERAIETAPKLSSNILVRIIGRTLDAEAPDPASLQAQLDASESDVVRCWAAHMVGGRALPVTTKLEQIRPYAADRHFGVREIAFMTVKESIAEALAPALEHLISWTQDPDENVRRFVVESTRPIGVWTNKIEALKTNPELGLPLLEPLRADPSRYVQDAVANWLNDASKTQPDWVEALCDRWSKASAEKSTAYIVKRALRTIHKARS